MSNAQLIYGDIVSSDAIVLSLPTRQANQCSSYTRKRSKMRSDSDQKTGRTWMINNIPVDLWCSALRIVLVQMIAVVTVQ